MQTAILLLIVFLAAFCVACYSVYTNEKFHTLFFLIYKSKAVVLYSVCYGIIGVVIFLLLKDDVLKITDNQTTLDTSYLKALGTGISTKAISEINLFNVRGGTAQFPFGIRTFTQPLDQFFERKFNDVGFVRSDEFLQPYYDKYKGKVKTITTLKDAIVTELKRFYPDQKEVGAFITSDNFVKAQESDEVLLLVLYEFGENVFKRIFDKIDPS